MTSMSNGSSGAQDDVRAARDTRGDRDPAGVAAHEFDDHHAVVRLGRGVEPVDRLGRDRHRGVEADRGVGADNVVVDRLGDADDGQPRRHRHLACGLEGAVAADADEAVELLVLRGLLDRVHAAVDLVRVAARGAEHRAAHDEDSGHVVRGTAEWRRRR